MKNKRQVVIIFDYDGTIADTLDLIYAYFISTAPKYGLYHLKTIKDFLSLYESNFHESLLQHGLSKKTALKSVHEFRIPLLDKIDKIPIFDKMKNIISQLSKKAVIFIVTSNLTNVIKASIKHYKIKGIKNIIGCDKEISKVTKINKIKKEFPDAEFYYIGDTCGDVKEAKKAKVKTIAVTWGYREKKALKKEKPDYIVDKPEDLLEVFED